MSRVSLRPKTGFVPTCAVVLMAALLAGCSVAPAAEREPERFREVARTFREGFSTHPTTSALIEDRETGCLYSLAEGRNATPLLTPNGVHAGCRTTTASASGYEAKRSEP